ncbi:MAG: hypothetical protein SCH71_17030 [Desulfobulbaceae bacterium]|nr:hypothetical protein [Desulfobulbaceae bacterium]
MKTLFAIAALSICLASTSLAFDSWSTGSDDGNTQPLSRHERISGGSGDGYESSFGNRYEYDMNREIDRMRYDLDVGAQLRDEIYGDISPRRDLEESLGEHGGGIYPND